MAALADHTNVFDTVISILEKKGYQIWYVGASCTYYAEKDGWDFASNSPVGLLGVVSIFEFLNPTVWAEYWWRMAPFGLHQELPDSPMRPYEPIYKRSNS